MAEEGLQLSPEEICRIMSSSGGVLVYAYKTRLTREQVEKLAQAPCVAMVVEGDEPLPCTEQPMDKPDIYIVVFKKQTA